MTATRRRTARTARTLRRMARAWLHARARSYARAYEHAHDETAGLWRASPGLGPTAPIRVPPAP